MTQDDNLYDVANQPKTPQRSVRIPDEVWLVVKAIAVEQGVTASDIVRQVLEEYLSEARR